ncbi:MAG: DUF3015 family protein [Thermodesulfobacteriota bacterium]
MKRLLLCALAVAVVLGVSVTNSSAKVRHNVGCGLGTMIFEQGTSDGLLVQVVAATTNGFLGNQTFGITSGTSECKQQTTIVSTETIQFVADNMDGIAKDIASGQGESLDTLSELMEIPAEDRSAFYGTLQRNFSEIFPSDKVEATDVIVSIASLYEKG